MPTTEDALQPVRLRLRQEQRMPLITELVEKLQDSVVVVLLFLQVVVVVVL